MARINITLETELLHGLFSKDGKDDAFAKLLETILNQVLEAQSTEQIGAARYERSDGRTAHRNGFRERDMTTRIGTITLRVPRHRDWKTRRNRATLAEFKSHRRALREPLAALIESHPARRLEPVA